MSTVEIVCLANSWKHGGRCVAGLRTDGGGWVRPVSDEPEGILQSWHYALAKGREAALLDVLKMQLRGPQPAFHHPENWLMEVGQWERSKKLSVPNMRDLLQNSLVAGPELLGDTKAKIAYAAFQEKPAAASLALVQPEALSWLIVRSSATGKRQIRAIFNLAGAAYNLPLTDPVWQTRLAILPEGCHAWKEAGLHPLLTISLGEPFGKESYCYKLVAGVVVLPQANLYQYLLQKRNLWPIIWDWMSGQAGRRRF